MRRTLLLLLAALFTLTLKCQAAVTISLTGNPFNGPQFFIGPGTQTVVPDGALIRIGTFTTRPAPSADFSILATQFREFARTTMGNVANPNTGRPVRNNITGGTGPESPDFDSFFVGRNVYIWVYATPNGDTAWTRSQGVFATDLTFQDQPAALSTSTTGYIHMFGRWSLGFDQASVEYDSGPDSLTAARFHLTGIPEPDSAILLALAAGFGFLRRR